MEGEEPLLAAVDEFDDRACRSSLDCISRLEMGSFNVVEGTISMNLECKYKPESVDKAGVEDKK